MRATLRKQKKFRGIEKRYQKGAKPTKSEQAFYYQNVYFSHWAKSVKPLLPISELEI